MKGRFDTLSVKKVGRVKKGTIVIVPAFRTGRLVNEERRVREEHHTEVEWGGSACVYEVEDRNSKR